MKLFIMVVLTSLILFIPSMICHDLSCDLLPEEIATLKKKISDIESCVKGQLISINNILIVN